MATKRRHRGEDSTYRKCHERYGCPPAVEVTTDDGKTIKRRPDHAKSCRAPWAYAISKAPGAGSDRRRSVLTAKTKEELLTKVSAYREKEALGVTPNAQTVGDWLDYWIERVAPTHGRDGTRGTTLRGYRSKIDLYLKPHLGKVKLQALTADHVESLHDWMRTLDKSRLPGNHGTGPLSETTIRQAHMVLRSALADALARRKVTYNAAVVVKAPSAQDNPHKHLGLDEAKAAIRAAGTERELCRMVCALALGLRQGEALGLRWQDYQRDVDGSYLMVLEAVQRVQGKLVRTDVKSRASRRRVPLPEKMVPIFDAWKTAAPRGESYIFPGPKGGPCDAKRDWSDWRAVLTKADVPLIPLHGARGSAASILADMGVPDWRIAEILGHSQVVVTRRHYIEGTDASHRKAIDGLIGELLA